MVDIKYKYINDINSVLLRNDIIVNNSSITSFDLNNTNFYNNSMNYTFSNCNNLTSVSNIPDSVRSMYYTFNNCTNLTNVSSIPNNLYYLWYTFNNCTNLVNTPNIPMNIARVSYAFSNCIKLKEIKLPYFATTVGYSYKNVNNTTVPCNIHLLKCKNLGYMFNSTANLKGDIYIYNPNITTTDLYYVYNKNGLSVNAYIPYKYENGVNSKTYNNIVNSSSWVGWTNPSVYNNLVKVYNNPYIVNDGTFYYYAPPSLSYMVNYVSSSGDVVLPKTYNGCDCLYETNIFCNNKTIVNVDLNNTNFYNNTLYNSFYNCSNLVNVSNLPDNVTNMYYTFFNCINLKSVSTIPNSVYDMSYAFYNCTNLTSIPNIPNSVTTMYYALYNCSNLSNIFIHSKLISNFTYTFSRLGMKNVYLPFYYTNGEHTVSYNSYNNLDPSFKLNTTLRDLVGYINYTIPPNSSIFIENTNKTNGVSSNISLYPSNYNYSIYNPTKGKISGTIDVTFNNAATLNVQNFPNLLLKKFKVIPDVSGATITYSYDNYEYTGDCVYVTYHTFVFYKIEKEGYVSKTGIQLIESDTEINVSLVSLSTKKTITINSTQSDVNSMIYNIEGDIYSSNDYASFTVKSKPEGATVMFLPDSNYSNTYLASNDNIIYVKKGNTIKYKLNSFTINGVTYKEYIGEYTVNNDTVLDVEMEIDDYYCCVPPYSQILYPNNITKNAEDVKIGDTIMGYAGHELFEIEVLNKIKVERKKYIIVIFDDESYLEITPDHPILTINGWKAYQVTEHYKKYCNDLGELKIGQEILKKDLSKTYKIIDIVPRSYDENMYFYTFDTTDGIDNYIADNCIVHNIPVC